MHFSVPTNTIRETKDILPLKTKPTVDSITLFTSADSSCVL